MALLWKIYNLTSPAHCGYSTSLAFDNNDIIHIVYGDYYSHVLGYMTFNPSLLNPPTPTPPPTAPPNPTTAPATTPKPAATRSPSPTAAPAPTPAPSATTVTATTDSGAAVTLAICGNVTCSQMSNVTINTAQSATTTKVSFTLTGTSGTTGFGNVTIPKSAVAYGMTPTIYIDNQPASNQGYTQDNNNYYVWYTTHFSTHQVSIVFTAKSSIPEFPSSIILMLLITSAVSVAVVLTLRKRKIGKS
jgi:hypothetical protein